MPKSVFCFLFLFLSCSFAHYSTFYVSSSDGSSSNQGTSDSPFASLSDAISATKANGNSALYVIVSPGMYTGPSNIGLNIDIEVVIAPNDSNTPEEVVFACGSSPVALTTSQAFSVVSRHNIYTRVQFAGCVTSVQFNGNLLTPLSFQYTDFVNFTSSAINSTAAQMLSISDCTFSTDSTMGALAINVSSLQPDIASEFTILGSDFTGAGIFAKNYLLGKITEVTLTNVVGTFAALNVVNLGDGAWYIISLDATNCKSYNNGGALQLRYMDTAFVTMSSFTDCMAQNGGAISASTNLGVVDSTFDSCSANHLGGAIYVKGGEYFFKSSTFSNCKAKFGAGIDLEGNILESGYEGLVFTNNYAVNGTSVSCCESSVHCELSSIDEFQITSYGGQGGIPVDCAKLSN